MPSIHTLPPITPVAHTLSLSLPQAKFAFLNSQSVDQIGAGVASDNSDSTTLDWDEFLECVARCGVDKYKRVKEMTPADAVKALMQNMLGEAEEEEVVVSTTPVRRPSAHGPASP